MASLALHSGVKPLERLRFLEELRSGRLDALVGCNLLREGLDLPEVSLVCVLSADKQGLLRSATSLVQTIGRAARHVNGAALLLTLRVAAPRTLAAASLSCPDGCSHKCVRLQARRCSTVTPAGRQRPWSRPLRLSLIHI